MGEKGDFRGFGNEKEYEKGFDDGSLRSLPASPCLYKIFGVLRSWVVGVGERILKRCIYTMINQSYDTLKKRHCILKISLIEHRSF